VYYIVQPYGPERARQATIVSTDDSVQAAYPELDMNAARFNAHELTVGVIEL
jgi:hypothetical protein